MPEKSGRFNEIKSEYPNKRELVRLEIQKKFENQTYVRHADLMSELTQFEPDWISQAILELLAESKIKKTSRNNLDPRYSLI